ncbi:hypothetical protein NQ317_018255 [Molorchus minor]|uniref:Uncharacterized protein n=1 Tax=Molorchus minor TaxID=1323400 RepID=A0ABQ9K5A1_9CUCU|nr:hypothetical protein NQ317_018255 [Molorchus minor]
MLNFLFPHGNQHSSTMRRDKTTIIGRQGRQFSPDRDVDEIKIVPTYMGQNHQGDEFGNEKFCKNYHVMEIQKDSKPHPGNVF